jgi:hypothetical protein
VGTHVVKIRKSRLLSRNDLTGAPDRLAIRLKIELIYLQVTSEIHNPCEIPLDNRERRELT